MGTVSTGASGVSSAAESSSSGGASGKKRQKQSSSSEDTSEQKKVLKKAAQEATPFCEECQKKKEEEQAANADHETKKEERQAEEEKADEETKEITRIFWIDEQSGEQKTLDTLPNNREITLCIDTKNIDEGEEIEVEITDKNGRDYKGGKKSLKFKATVEADGSAYVENVKLEYD